MPDARYVNARAPSWKRGHCPQMPAIACEGPAPKKYPCKKYRIRLNIFFGSSKTGTPDIVVKCLIPEP